MATIEQVARLLRHSERENRRKAILWLAKSADDQAIKPLTWAMNNDPDPELQLLARQGINRVKAEIAPVEEDDPFAGLFDEDGELPEDDLLPEEPEPDLLEDDPSTYGDAKPLSNRARALINEAMDAHLNGNDVTAIKKLLQALDWDTSARTDMKALNVASAVMGLPGEEAIAALNNPDQRDQLLKRLQSQQVNKQQQSHADVPPWSRVWSDIAIFALVTAAGWTILLVLSANRFTPLLQDFVVSDEYRQFLLEEQGEDFLTPILDYLDEGILILIVIGLVMTLFSVLVTLLQNTVIHWAATKIFNGTRPLAVTMDQLIIFQAAYTVLLFVLYVGNVLLTPNTLQPYLEQGIEGATATANLVTGTPQSLLSLASPFLMSYMVMRAQKFSYGNGCLSILIGTIIFFALYCACIFAGSFVLVSVLGAAMSSA